MSEICCVVDRCWGASDVCLEAFLEKLSEKRQKASAIYDQTIVNLMRRRKLESSSKSEQRCYYGFVTFWQRSLWEIRVWFQNSIKFLFTFQTNPIELGMTNWVNDKICMKIESLFSLCFRWKWIAEVLWPRFEPSTLGSTLFSIAGKNVPNTKWIHGHPSLFNRKPR